MVNLNLHIKQLMTLKSDIMDKVCQLLIKILMMNYFTALLKEGCRHKKIKIVQRVNYLFVNLSMEYQARILQLLPRI